MSPSRRARRPATMSAAICWRETPSEKAAARIRRQREKVLPAKQDMPRADETGRAVDEVEHRNAALLKRDMVIAKT